MRDVRLEAEHQAPVGRVPFVAGTASPRVLLVGNTHQARLVVLEVVVENRLRARQLVTIQQCPTHVLGVEVFEEVVDIHWRLLRE